MEPHEILPPPEASNQTEQLESVDSFNESQLDKAIEHKQGAKHGSPALSGMAVNDANGQVQSAQSAQAVNDLGGTASNMVQIDVPETADDIDLIEKAWVAKAKEIVNRTQGDPFVQNKELNRMKVDYIKKRYDKDIKSSEES